MGKFKEDLERGRKMEEKAMDILNNNGFNVIKNPDKKGIDLLLLENGIEIKFDKYAKVSGNFYIEFECNGTPSGIFKEEEFILKYWGHSDGDNLFLLEGKKFKKWVAKKIKEAREQKSSLPSHGFMVVEKGGDGGRTKGLVLKVDLLKKQAYKTYKI